MKVLFVTRGYPSKDDLMNGNYEAVQAKALAKKGVDVSLFCIGKVRSFIHLLDKTKVDAFEDEGVRVYRINPALPVIPKMWFLSIARLNDWIIKKAFYKLYIYYYREQGKPDVVHAHMNFSGARVSFLKDDFKLPFVITEHWSMMIKEDMPDWLQNISQIYYKADALICVSQALADSLKKHFQVNCTIINNMVSDKFFKTSKVNRCDNTFRFVACGAFRDKNKGFDVLVDAFAMRQFPKEVHLDIIGDGPDRSFIERKIADYHLTNQINLLGVKKPEEVSDILCNSDCFVLSSRLETFAIVVIEAMAKGLPVIATRCGGPETFLRSEHGILVEKENLKELADAMNYMVEHHSDYNSEEIRKYCYDHFSQDVIADQIIGVYNKVLNNY